MRPGTISDEFPPKLQLTKVTENDGRVQVDIFDGRWEMTIDSPKFTDAELRSMIETRKREIRILSSLLTKRDQRFLHDFGGGPE
jgi:hypothetical protein